MQDSEWLLRARLRGRLLKIITYQNKIACSNANFCSTSCVNKKIKPKNLIITPIAMNLGNGSDRNSIHGLPRSMGIIQKNLSQRACPQLTSILNRKKMSLKFIIKLFWISMTEISLILYITVENNFFYKN